MLVLRFCLFPKFPGCHQFDDSVLTSSQNSAAAERNRMANITGRIPAAFLRQTSVGLVGKFMATFRIAIKAVLVLRGGLRGAASPGEECETKRISLEDHDDDGFKLLLRAFARLFPGLRKQ